jgi:hypothetical protein
MARTLDMIIIDSYRRWFRIPSEAKSFLAKYKKWYLVFFGQRFFLSLAETDFFSYFYAIFENFLPKNAKLRLFFGSFCIIF